MQIWRRYDRTQLRPTISTIQLDSLGQQLVIGMYSFAGKDLQLFSLNF
jgi:hypothetical protein